MAIITVPEPVLLAMATSSAHDRLARPEVLARRVFEHGGNSYLPVWAEFEKGGVREVVAVDVETSLYDHELLWHSNKLRWKLRFAGNSVRFRSEWPATGTDDGEVDLARLRIDPSSYGRMVARYDWLIASKSKWLRGTQMGEEDADSLALAAFESALDRVTFRPGARLRHVIYNVTHQRLLNLIRDRQRGGILHQSRKDVEFRDIGRAYTLEATDPFLGASKIAREFAALILEEKTPEQAMRKLKLKKRDFLNVKAEIAAILGVEI